MFCLPHSMPFSSRGSPGSDSFVLPASRSREAILLESARAGDASAPSSSLRAPAVPLSEPATPTQRVFSPCAGTLTV